MTEDAISILGGENLNNTQMKTLRIIELDKMKRFIYIVFLLWTIFLNTISSQ